MDLSTLGAIATILYCVGVFLLQWVSDWYFNVIKSPFLDYISNCLAATVLLDMINGKYK